MVGGKTTYSGIVGEGRLDSALASALPDLSRARIQALIAEDALLIDGQIIVDGSSKKFGGQRFELNVPAPRADKAEAQDIKLHIVYEDAQLIGVDKPAGLVVHPAAGHADGTLVNALLHHCRGKLSGIGGVQRPGIVHRIDKDTSGLLVVAKSDVAHEGLAKLFAAHDIERKYFAIVSGSPAPPAGTVRTQIGRSTTNRKKMAVLPENKGKHYICYDHNPFKRPPKDLDYISDTNTGKCYGDTYDELITDPTTQVLCEFQVAADGTHLGQFSCYELTQMQIALGCLSREAREPLRLHIGLYRPRYRRASVAMRLHRKATARSRLRRLTR